MIKLDNTIDSFKIFQNNSVSAIGYKIGLNTNLISKKNSVSVLSNEMLKYLQIDIKELKQLNISIKTIRLQPTLKPKEAMSFEKVDFHQVIEEQWDSSFLKKKFMSTTFLFVVFQYFGEELYFRGVKAWQMPTQTIETELQHFWRLLHSRLTDGVVLTETIKANQTVTKNNLPSSTDSKIMHIRPKAKNSKDVTELPDGQFISKQAYWFNTSYVAEIVSDIPELQIAEGSLTTQNKNHRYTLFTPFLNTDIYTIDQFIQLVQRIEASFNELCIEEKSLNAIGYTLSPPYILKRDFINATHYFEKQILNNRYFELPKEEIWQTSFVARLIDNLENGYSLFKIGDASYLTITGLTNAQVDKETLKAYKKAVEDFVQPNYFFSLASLKKTGFQHMIDDFGFEAIFYESILKRPGRLQNIRLCGNTVFIKCARKQTLYDFIKAVLQQNNQPFIDTDDLVELLAQQYGLHITFDEMDHLLKGSSNLKGIFYSPHLTKLFINKQIYLDQLY